MWGYKAGMKYRSDSSAPIGRICLALLASTLVPSGIVAACPQEKPYAQDAPKKDIAAQPDKTPTDWVDWLKQGHYWVGARLRYEDVDQDSFSNRANALTLRTVLGFQTAQWRGLSGTLEFEDVTALFEENYDSTTNGNTQFPKVVDPEGAEINQAFLEHSEQARWDVRVGRQRINFDNQRFVGGVAWRQNEQTFDAVKLTALNLAGIEATYVYVDNVNRINGDNSTIGDLPSHTHLFHLSRQAGPLGTLVAYAYLLDSDRDPRTSTDSFGVRLSGKHAPERELGFLWAAEVATQKDVGDNPNDVDQPYYLGELGASLRGFVLTVGHELLGGSGKPGDAFQTPLATLHSFNGWADKFLVTPDDGLNDSYAGLETTLAKVKCQAVWHIFDADHGSDHYGNEIDLALSYPLRKELLIGVKYADYDSDKFATDTTKFWVWVTISI